ncbi:L-threonine 3-dehydrogenase [Planctomycetes bacterium Pan216]|uniref:L-threonine 3-dehydrogenase n=1 Tax=Kolteria novifilia TaxID=2527975 RepID=A0A518B730_9BACT|nr:L-threonine 3-dehydrogenase [Planctomycetes bacterium Pan216]
MKAIVYDGPNQMHLEDLPESSPQTGEVKLRVAACGICGSDVHGYTGESGRRTPGQVMGHEFAGEVVDCGEGVSDWKPGDRVAAFNIIGCGACPFCAAGQVQCCPDRKVLGVNTGKVGAFAEYISVPAENLAVLNDEIPYAEALLNEPLAVSYHALANVPESAKTLAIVGGGTIGQSLAMVAKVMGKWDVYLMEPLEEKRALAERQGAKAIPSNVETLRAHLKEDHGSDAALGADAVIEAVGIEKTVLTALDAARPGGTVVLLGNLAKEVTLPLQHISSNEKHLVGTYGFNAQDFRQIVTWINEGRFDLTPMITGTCTLEETPRVFEDLAAGRRQAVKIVVEP